METATVLIADPDPGVRERHEVGLARAGFTVVSAVDGTTALRLASRLLPHSLLTEIVLPNLDGFHLAQRLRRQPTTRDMGIVAVTAYEGDDLRQRATEAGIDAVLNKSRSMDDVVRVLRETTRNSRAVVQRSVALRREMDLEIYRNADLRARAEDVLVQSREVADAIARAIGEPAVAVSEEMLREADGARDVMVVDRDRGEQLFKVLLERHRDHPVLHYKRGEAYRAIGRRKLAYEEFMLAAEHLPDGVWRTRAQLAAMRTRSHHEKAK